MKLKKIFLLLLLILLALSCGKKENSDILNNKEKTGKKEKSVEEQIKEMVNIWNEASSNADFDTLDKILGDKIEYYQSSVTKAYYISDQKKFFEKNPVYGQKIKGDIIVTQISNKQVKAEFVKEVTTKKGVKDYPSYLVFENVNGEWKLILESDTVSDANIENRKKRANENPNKSTYEYGKPVSIVGTFEIRDVELERGNVKGYFIRLNTPITLLKDEHIRGVENNKLIQLLFVPENEDSLAGKKVLVTGQFFPPETDYHSTPVILDVSEIKILN
jgi:hypothetical protein